MIKLNELQGDSGSRQGRKRVGRGESSGLGKTSGRGHKGAGSRSGAKKGKGFEGGQTTLSRRVPKRGFSRTRWQVPTAVFNCAFLNQFEDGAVVNEESMRAAGFLKKTISRFKILGKGDVEKKLTVVAHAFSESAKKKIEAAGGSCELAAPVEVDEKTDAQDKE